MNENVQILEGNTTRRFSPIDKVEVDTTTEGETSMWVPKDDHTTGVLYASENGIYIASEDGYDSYSEVVIRVEKRIDDGDLTDESGTDWKDIDFDGDVGNFDELDNWDVDTLEEFSDDLEGFDDLFNDEDKWDEEKEKPITEDEMDDFTGDSISGIDPEDGNVYEYGVDEDGNLTEAMLPSAIHIVIAPRKKDYVAGETIDFSGIHVYLLDGNNHLFKNEQYSTGEIPFKELLFPVTIASETDGYGSIQRLPDYMEARIPQSLPLSGGASFEFLGTYNWVVGVEISLSAACIFFHTDSNYGVFIFASKEEFDFGISTWKKNKEPVPIEIDQHSNSYTKDGKTVHYTPVGTSWLGKDYPATEIEDADSDYVYNYAHVIAWHAIYGEVSGVDSNIPVQWLRSDGEMLEDHFSITVKPKPSTESNNSTSDSGSEHTSGGF